MSRFNDIIQGIKGGFEEEPKPRSGIDTVKDFLKAAAMTTVAGAVGGEAGMRALGGYAQAQAAGRERRRLEKIARAKDELAAMRDIASIEASEANVAEGKRRLDLTEKDQFMRQVERTEEGQQRLRELKAKLDQDAKFEAERNAIEREKWGIKKADNVAKAKAKLAGDQARKAKNDLALITGASRNAPLNPSDVDAINKAVVDFVYTFRNLGVKTADQAKKTWETMKSTVDDSGRPAIKLSNLIESDVYNGIIRQFEAEEQHAREQARVAGGFLATGGISSNPGVINSLAQYAPAMPELAEQQLNAAATGQTGAVNKRRFWGR